MKTTNRQARITLLGGSVSLIAMTALLGAMNDAGDTHECELFSTAAFRDSRDRAQYRRDVALSRKGMLGKGHPSETGSLRERGAVISIALKFAKSTALSVNCL